VIAGAGDDGDRADEGHEQEHTGGLDRHEMAAEQFGAQPGHLIGRERVGGWGFGRRVGAADFDGVLQHTRGPADSWPIDSESRPSSTAPATAERSGSFETRS
jgi:hypothetical protein